MRQMMFALGSQMQVLQSTRAKLGPPKIVCCQFQANMSSVDSLAVEALTIA
jgi:hypothetical protein